MTIIKTTKLNDQGWTPAYFASRSDANRLHAARRNSAAHRAIVSEGITVEDDRDERGYGYDARAGSLAWSDVTTDVIRIGIA